jgi:hypothetical protein
MIQATTEFPITGSRCRVANLHFGGWRALTLKNGIIELFVVPEIGGRAIQLRFCGSDLFYVNPRHAGRVYRAQENSFEGGWKNYGGSKVWPAPQGWSSDSEWPGPPDPILDGGVYSCQILEQGDDTAALRLESPRDEYTGLIFSRVIRIFRDSASIEVRHTMRNAATRRVRWSIWQVTQQAASVHTTVFVPTGSYRQIFGDEPYEGVTLDAEASICRFRYADRVAKFGTKPEQGWVATLDSSRGVALLETFPLYPALVYPDDAPVELWVNGHGSFTAHGDTIEMEHDLNGCDAFIETEVLSPLVQLEPEEEYSFPTVWHVTSMQSKAVVSVNGCAAIGCPLSAERQASEVRISGSFGLLRCGTLEIASILRNGKVEEVRELGAVTPLAACTIDSSLPFRPGLFRVSLRLRDSQGNLLGTLDSALVR